MRFFYVIWFCWIRGICYSIIGSWYICIFNVVVVCMIFFSWLCNIWCIVVVFFCVMCILVFFYEISDIFKCFYRVWILSSLFGFIGVVKFSWIVWWSDYFIGDIFFIWYVLFCFIRIIIIISRIDIIKVFFGIRLVCFSRIRIVKFVIFGVEVIRLVFFVWWVCLCFFSRIVKFFRVIFSWKV